MGIEDSDEARGFGKFAATFEEGVCAGIIESSKGSARVTPAPRNTARRERCFLVMNMRSPSLLIITC